MGPPPPVTPSKQKEDFRITINHLNSRWKLDLREVDLFSPYSKSAEVPAEPPQLCVKIVRFLFYQNRPALESVISNFEEMGQGHCICMAMETSTRTRYASIKTARGQHAPTKLPRLKLDTNAYAIPAPICRDVIKDGRALELRCSGFVLWVARMMNSLSAKGATNAAKLLMFI
jgi:hypothetical protein